MKSVSSSSWKPISRAAERHLVYEITQCYLPRNTGERAPPQHQHTGQYSFYLRYTNERLS